MATPKEEKLLASIDGTLKDILKELKREGRNNNNNLFHISGAQILKNPPLDSDVKTFLKNQK